MTAPCWNDECDRRASCRHWVERGNVAGRAIGPDARDCREYQPYYEAITLRVSQDLYDRLGSVPGHDRCMVARKILRRYHRHISKGGVDLSTVPQNTTYGGTVLRLVDLQGLADGLDAASLRRVLEWGTQHLLPLDTAPAPR